MNIYNIPKIYHQEIYLFLNKFLIQKAKEAKKTAPETFYFIDAARKYILPRTTESLARECGDECLESSRGAVFQSHRLRPVVRGLQNQCKSSSPFLAYSIYKSLGGENDKDFFNLSASLVLVDHFFAIFDALSWKKSAVKNKLIQSIFKKYKNDKTKSDPTHITFSQNLILGDIISGFSYELVLTSNFSNAQKIKIFEELNNIIKWHEIGKLAGKKKFDYFMEGSKKIAALARGEKHGN